MNFQRQKEDLGDMAIRATKLVTCESLDFPSELGYLELWYCFSGKKRVYAIHWDREVDYVNEWSKKVLMEDKKEVL